MVRRYSGFRGAALAAIAGVALMACSSRVSNRQPDTTSPSADAASPNDLAPSVDGGGVAWETGAQQISVESGGRTRTGRLYVPASIDGTAPVPLVMIFHGGGGDSERMVALGFDDLADDHGFVTVYPDGVEGNWADGRGTTDAALAGVDDVAFVRDLIAHLAGRLPLDADRVYATGASNGAILSYRLGCQLSSQITAIAPVIGAVATNIAETCNPELPVSVLSIHGTEDPFIDFESGGEVSHDDFPRLGDGGLVESAASSRDIWKENNNCADAEPQRLSPLLEDDPTRVVLTAMDECDRGTSVHFYVVEGMGHTWPGTVSARPAVSGPTSRQINATQAIWDFFSSKTR